MKLFYLSLTEFIGHLHPLIVHLPIGILLLACLFLWQSRRNRSEDFHRVIDITLLLGMFSALAACITGYVLSRTGDYDAGTVALHQWMGIGVALLSMLTFYFRKNPVLRRWQSLSATLLLLLIFITGHLGGTLTHGAGYLLGSLDQGSDEDSTIVHRKPIPDVQEAIAYADLVEPVFRGKCYSCHGPNKQKGRLRLDGIDWILKGGKHGPALVKGLADSSELIKRLLLPKDDEHHMAPEQKPQVTKEELAIIRWWIDNGADTGRKVKDIPQPEGIKPMLRSMEQPLAAESEDGLPAVNVPEPAEKDLTALRETGAVVHPIAQNSRLLSVSFLTVSSVRDSALLALLPLRENIVWLKLSGAKLPDSATHILAQLENLSNLQLDHTTIDDKALQPLTSLKHLRSLNLVGTAVTAAGIRQLTVLPELKSVYLYQTRVSTADWLALKAAFPKTTLDSGGYQVPLLPSDTTIVKPPKSATR